MMLSISWQLTLVALCIMPISSLLVGTSSLSALRNISQANRNTWAR